MKRPAFHHFLAWLTISAGMASAGDFDESRGASPTLKLDRGICIDRQLRSYPPESYLKISQDDVRLIKSMGFEFVKLIFNPAVLKLDGDLDSVRMEYFDEVVNLIVDEGLPVVVCIHPEADFKTKVFGNAEEFARFVQFMKALSRHMESRWRPDELAFQLMTEPFGSSPNPEDWNHWDRLQKQLWAAVRSGMPGHTLILSGDLVGAIDGLFNITPVDDDNVFYSFTFYEPLLFTQQGTGPETSEVAHLKNLPYPSGPEMLSELPGILSAVPEEFQSNARARVEQYAAEHWDESKLAARMDRLSEWQQRAGIHAKLWCAEFGCYQAARPADRLRHVSEVRSLLEQHDVGWCYWSYNESFSVMTSERTPFGPAHAQTPDEALLRMLLPERDVSD